MIWRVLQRESPGKMEALSTDNSRGLTVMEVKKREDNSQKRARKKFLFIFVFEMEDTKIYLNGMRMELIGRK